ncbi:ABC transporter permease [Bradyrhizobium sp. NP1]|uniref:ABC transporter permease n=1 Tax=Bradyrhizobium sp. NP1 TaxID=3049772 RepID=UPI0025A4D2FD|nr:ABC transporter permease [Bradyrhizobium sp. NP1]WJR77261.1 ABC transporter permease [Bradyrhizobium sp. NP1]
MTITIKAAQLARPAPSSAMRRLWRSDVFRLFRTSPAAVVAAILALTFVALALFAPHLAQQNPYDPASYDIVNSERPPAWMAEGTRQYLLGTDDQGRSILALILYGLRISMLVGLISIAIAIVVGVALGLISGYLGGWIDTVVMRIVDVQASFPPILIALLIDGVARAAIPAQRHEDVGIPVLIVSIALSKWALFARTMRASVLVEKKKEYVQAAHLLFLNPFAVMLRHVLPNALGPVLVLATVNLSMAILTEATLSFLGTGVPPTTPSLGTLIKIGNDYLFSGVWWITVFPGLVLIALVFSFNVLGDWLRDVLNPRLRT